MSTLADGTEGAERVPHPEEQARRAKRRHDPLESGGHGTSDQAIADGGGNERHRQSGSGGEQEQACNRVDAIGGGSDQQNTHACRSTQAVYQTDSESRGRRSAYALGVAMRMRGWVAGLRCVLVDVRVGVTNVAMSVRMRMEVPTAPAQQKADGEKRRDDAHEKLCRVSHDLWQLRPEHHDRHTEQKERRRVPETPEEAEHTGTSPAAAVIRQDERGYRGEVIRVGRMPRAQQEGDDEAECQAAAAESENPLIKKVHARCFHGSAQ